MQTNMLASRVRITLYAAILLYGSILHSGSVENFSQSVVFLRQSVPFLETINGTEFEVWLKIPGTEQLSPKQTTLTGTGLIVGSSNNICYLVTAKHVAIKMTEQCEIVLRGLQKKPLHITLDAITGQPMVKWIHHEKADVSIHPLPSITADGVKILEQRAFPIAGLESHFHLPSRDITLSAVGFPLGLGAEGEFIPLSRESKLSSGMLTDKEVLYFLLQDPSVSGYSGSPIIQSGTSLMIATGARLEQIINTNGNTRCWGFVSGTFGDESGGKMSKITPAGYAVEVIRKFESDLIVNSAPEPATTKAK